MITRNQRLRQSMEELVKVSAYKINVYFTRRKYMTYRKFCKESQKKLEWAAWYGTYKR